MSRITVNPCVIKFVYISCIFTPIVTFLPLALKYIDNDPAYTFWGVYFCLLVTSALYVYLCMLFCVRAFFCFCEDCFILTCFYVFQYIHFSTFFVFFCAQCKQHIVICFFFQTICSFNKSIKLKNRNSWDCFRRYVLFRGFVSSYNPNSQNRNSIVYHSYVYTKNSTQILLQKKQT